MTSRASNEGKLTCLSSSLGWHCVTIEVQELSWTEERRQKKDAHIAPRIKPVLNFPSERVGLMQPPRPSSYGNNRSLAGSNLDSFAFYSVALRVLSYLNTKP